MNTDDQLTLSEVDRIKKSNTAMFNDITEAWMILSRETMRKQYDLERMKKFGIISNTIRNMHTPINNEVINISNVISTHQKVYEAKKMSNSSEWKEKTSKYKTDVWRKLDIDDKKVNCDMNLVSHY